LLKEKKLGLFFVFIKIVALDGDFSARLKALDRKAESWVSEALLDFSL